MTCFSITRTRFLTDDLTALHSWITLHSMQGPLHQHWHQIRMQDALIQLKVDVRYKILDLIMCQNGCPMLLPENL